MQQLSRALSRNSLTYLKFTIFLCDQIKAAIDKASKCLLVCPRLSMVNTRFDYDLSRIRGRTEFVETKFQLCSAGCPGMRLSCVSPQSSECWNYKCAPLYLALDPFFNVTFASVKIKHLAGC